ncbi:carboxypeptidase-like regulatory domain-containing protein [Streptomyces sp. NPDC050095]|uniref:carboxypeptidase-like regulatory domain-containing protein n=1 Tax=unclassified Streptomyces TaxID=2593676 RepID=UPI0034163EB0
MSADHGQSGKETHPVPTRTPVLLTATAAACALVLLPLPASAADAPAPVGVGRAVTDPAQRGTFSVTAWTDTAGATLTDVSATVRSGDTVVAEAAHLTELTWSKGTFKLPADRVLKLAEDQGTIPALGRYAIDVTATDSAGHTTTRKDAGVLDFTLRPQLAVDLSVPSWQDRTTHVTGTLTGIQPGSGDLVPLDGRTVTLDRTKPADGGSTPRVTSATGEFAADFTVDIGDTFKASFAEDSAQVHGNASAETYVYSWQPRYVTVTAASDRTRVLPGQSATITGKVTDKADGTPIAGTDVRVAVPNGPSRTVTTDAAGAYTAQLAAATGLFNADTYTVTPVDRYLSGGATGPLYSPAESRFTGVHATLAANGKVTVTGALGATYATDGSLTNTQNEPIVVEYSKDGTSGWKKAGSATVQGWNSNDFSITSAAGTGGYYRVHHPLTDRFTESTGPVAHLTRRATRIASLNAGPEPVTKGKPVRVTGFLQEANSGWKPMKNTRVSLYFRPKGSTTWSYVTAGKTDSTGWVALTGKATKDGTWVIRYFASGDSTHFYSTSYEDYVDVR